MLAADEGAKVDVKQNSDGSISIPALKRSEVHSSAEVDLVTRYNCLMIKILIVFFIGKTVHM